MDEELQKKLAENIFIEQGVPNPTERDYIIAFLLKLRGMQSKRAKETSNISC